MATWTYSGDPASSNKDAVRWLIGDTNTNDQLACDEEINYALAETNDDVYLASAMVANSIAGKFARDAESAIDSVRVSLQQRYQQYSALASKLLNDRKTFGATTSGLLITGKSISEMDSVDEDEDIPNPFFRRDMFRNDRNIDNDFRRRY